MKVLTKSLLIILFIVTGKLSAQSVSLYRDTSIAVDIANMRLENAWTGGFNAPVFADMDLNGDGKMDLIVFDWVNRNIFRMNCFINNGSTTKNPWIFAPKYEKLFPKGLEGWIRTYDYDHDGDMDLFSYYISGGLELYRNDYTPTNGLSFNQVPILVNTHYGTFATPIYVTRVDMPALTDLENDSDMDVLAFSISGNLYENNKNIASDSSTGFGNLNYIYNITGCWGYFYTNASYNTAILYPGSSGTCFLGPANPFRTKIEEDKLAQYRHNGSATLALDIDGDGDQDIIVGDVGGTNLLMINNCGTPDSAYACAYDSIFPNYNIPVIQPGSPFPAPYYFDADNDGKKDLIAANFVPGAENYNNVQLYKNTTNNSTNVFSHVTNRFLANTMIDVGSSAHPVLVDIDGDGLKDMLIGNDFYSSPHQTKIAFYKNIGTSLKAKFHLITDDFDSISNLGILGVFPTFGDLDGDNDLDMILGEDGGSLIYYQNIGTATSPNFIFSQANYQSINVSAAASPQLIDVDRDGKLDLVIGNRIGTLSYYKNTGSVNAPIFTLQSNNFGAVNVSAGAIAGLSAPCLFDHNGSYELLVGSISGYLYHYTNIDGNLSGAFTLQDSMFQNIYEPARCVPAIADLDGDTKYDVVVGNSMGGVALYTQNVILSVANIDAPNSSFFNLFPNPVKDVLYLEFNNINQTSKIQLEIVDVLGKNVIKTYVRSGINTIDISNLSLGTYLIHANNGKQIFARKFVKE